ncbi:MAG: hypothetical protein CMIDDMOC_00331 [Sodalis sp. Fle]|nr:MAG: hypothetical protein CMIDDMOC_00331 [Sodalis sp. Fle]
MVSCGYDKVSVSKVDLQIGQCSPKVLIRCNLGGLLQVNSSMNRNFNVPVISIH